MKNCRPLIVSAGTWHVFDAVSPIEAAGRSDTIGHLNDIAIRVRWEIYWNIVRDEIVGDDEAARMRRGGRRRAHGH
ncbi:MAG TPA: hypothetical protein PL033_19725 [Candidatus Brocadiia bacterium]|nr:hypothetical protein [Candidatus Brocadiia bacterium]